MSGEKHKFVQKECRSCWQKFNTEDEDEEYCLWCRQDIEIQNDIDSLRGG